VHCLRKPILLWDKMQTLKQKLFLYFHFHFPLSSCSWIVFHGAGQNPWAEASLIFTSILLLSSCSVTAWIVCHVGPQTRCKLKENMSPYSCTLGFQSHSWTICGNESGENGHSVAPFGCGQYCCGW